MDFGVATEIGISRLVLTYSGWLFGGVFTGFHWLAFVPDICYNLSGYYGLFIPDSGVVEEIPVSVREFVFATPLGDQQVRNEDLILISLLLDLIIDLN